MDRSSPLFADRGGYFSSGSIDANGRLLVALSSFDPWFNRVRIVDTVTGRITRVPATA